MDDMTVYDEIEQERRRQDEKWGRPIKGTVLMTDNDTLIHAHEVEAWLNAEKCSENVKSDPMTQIQGMPCSRTVPTIKTAFNGIMEHA